ncbi:GNAT family N-acetyltransferase [Saccharibacillus sacchari]|uniref:GNAT family N-acetyltransferase n=1 Tax=Saccharibacillus sacchari TaxID=456493 RepID=A0ACC6PAE2_9BACL
MSPFTLDCEHIRLRGFLPEDLDDFCAITAEPHIRRFLPDWHVDRETRRIWLRDYEIPGNAAFLNSAKIDGNVGDQTLRLAVIERSSGRFVGWCCTGIKEELPPPNREVVYGLTEACRGKGYMTQAVAALTEWLFAHTRTDIVHGLAKPDNIASNRVLQKCGFDDLGEIALEDGVHKRYARRRE